MDYEDDEILWYQEHQEVGAYGDWMKLTHVNLAIKFHDSKLLFEIVKNRWGWDQLFLPLNFLDLFLEFPDADWNKWLEQYKFELDKTYESEMVRK
jgi:hypothetical protein